MKVARTKATVLAKNGYVAADRRCEGSLWQKPFGEFSGSFEPMSALF